MPNRIPPNANLPLPTPENHFRTSDHSFKSREEIVVNSAQQQPLSSINIWSPMRIKNADLSEKHMQDFHTAGITSPSGGKHTAFPATKPYYNFAQTSKGFQQNAPYGRKFGTDQMKFSSSHSSAPQTFTPPQLLAAFDPQQYSKFNLQQNQTNNLYSTSLADHVKTSQAYNVPQHSYQPLSFTNPACQPLSTRFNVSSRGQQSQTTRERFDRSSFMPPNQFEERGTQLNPYNTHNPWSPRNPQVTPFKRTYASQQNTYSTLPRNFKSHGHNFAGNSGFSQSDSLSMNSIRNMWRPSMSSMDNKYWDHAKTN